MSAVAKLGPGLRRGDAEVSFTSTITVDRSPFEAFAAIVNVPAWWTGEVKGKFTNVGDEFTFRYGDVHSSTHRLAEVIPEKRIVWEITQAHLSFAANPAEWVGTRMVFDIAKKAGKTEVRFTHEGLTPSCDCYEGCDEGWRFFIQESLKSLIETGRGLKM